MDIMGPMKAIRQWWRVPEVTRRRRFLVLAAAVTADVLQFCLGPLGWAGLDQAMDVAAFVLTVWAIGFHPLLLPTFVAEWIPAVDLLPTWTACVLAVIALRRRAQGAMASTRLPAKSGSLPSDVTSPTRACRAPRRAPGLRAS
jgi:hypothetical protein